MTGCHQPCEKVMGTEIPVAWFAHGLRIIDIANPHAPKEVAHFMPDVPPGSDRVQSNDVTVDDRGLIYLLDRVRGLTSSSGPERRPSPPHESTAICLRSISSKSILAPRPGLSMAWTRPLPSTSMSCTSPYFCVAVRQQHLEILAVRDRHDHVQVGDVVERVAAVVHLEVHVEGLGEVGDLEQRGDAALHRHVAAQDSRSPACMSHGA